MSGRSKFKVKHAAHPRMKLINAKEKPKTPPRIPEVVLAIEAEVQAPTIAVEPPTYVEFTSIQAEPAPDPEPIVETPEIVVPVVKAAPVVKKTTKSAPKKRSTTRKRTRKAAKTKTSTTPA